MITNAEINALQRMLDFVQDERKSSKSFWDWLYLQDYDLDTFGKAQERAAKLLVLAKNAIAKLREEHT